MIAAEIRFDDGKGSWRRKGVRRSNRELIEAGERVCFERLSDWASAIPASLRTSSFTSESLSREAGIPRALARKTLYVLSRCSVVQVEGKEGRCIRYMLNRTPVESNL